MGEYTVRGAGTVVFSTSGADLSPTVTHSVGDLLILHSAQRAGAETMAAMTGWTQLGSTNTNGSLEVWARIADGGANDAPTVNWSGTTFCDAWIEAYYGDVVIDLGAIIAASNTYTVSSSAEIVIPSLTVPEADCLIIVSSRKNKTGTSNDNTFSAPGSFTERNEYVYAGTGNAHCSASWQQTSASNVSQTNWGRTGTAESLASNALIFALFSTTSSIVTVTNVPDLYGNNVATVTGTGFGTNRGSGQVYIAPTDSIADANKVAQTILSWSDTSIVMTVARGNLNYNTNLYLFVVKDGGAANSSGYVVQIKSGITLTWTA